MIEYVVDGKLYGISYSELKENYHRYVAMSDDEFRGKIVQATHFACIVSWFKELPAVMTIGDKGLIHEMLHYQMGFDTITLKEIRKMFKFNLKLV